MQTYEQLLNRGLSKVPEKLKEKSRFEIPKAKTMKAGLKTNIENFLDIARDLRRDHKHVQKFLLKELATKGELLGKRLVVIGNFSEDLVNKKIDLYVKSYVTCLECKKPDTKIVQEEGYNFLVCEACGAKHPIPKIS